MSHALKPPDVMTVDEFLVWDFTDRTDESRVANRSLDLATKLVGQRIQPGGRNGGQIAFSNFLLHFRHPFRKDGDTVLEGTEDAAA